jgi:hypothetical protein
MPAEMNVRGLWIVRCINGLASRDEGDNLCITDGVRIDFKDVAVRGDRIRQGEAGGMLSKNVACDSGHSGQQGN